MNTVDAVRHSVSPNLGLEIVPRIIKGPYEPYGDTTIKIRKGVVLPIMSLVKGQIYNLDKNKKGRMYLPISPMTQ
jgi:hypothetical protein